jgi:hypothetical protein
MPLVLAARLEQVRLGLVHLLVRLELLLLRSFMYEICNR